MEEIEVPTEQIQEEMHERAEHARERWVSYVALSSALIAVFAAITALLAGHHSNEAMIEQIQASDKWSYYQAKGIKSAILSSRIEVLQSLGKEVAEKDKEKVDEYRKEQEEISTEAHERESASHEHLRHHQILAKAVTMFQIAIAIAAISVLMKRRRFWFLSLAFSALGIVFFVLGIR